MLLFLQKLRDELQSIDDKFIELSGAITTSFSTFNSLLDNYQKALQIDEDFIL